MLDIRERFRAEVIAQLAHLEPAITDQVLQRVDTVPVFDDVDTYIAVAAMVVRAALEAALQPTFARLDASEAAARADIARLELIEAFYWARTSKTVH